MSASGQCGCGLQACGCCAGIEKATPKPIDNRPGLSALAVRVGRHGEFLASMLARLSSHAFPDKSRPLAALRTRDPDDPAIALLDAFAIAGDVLAFYNERIANEGYLRTATDFGSIEKLAGLVGYAPDPGVAASVFLAFGIDSNVIGAVDIARGTRVQSVPGQDELPQSFETSSPLAARAAWNRIGLRMREPQRVEAAMEELFFAGTATRLKAGDALLFELEAEAAPVPMRVLEVVEDVAADRTRVRCERWSGVKFADPVLEGILAEQSGASAPTATTIIKLLKPLNGMERLQATVKIGEAIAAINAMLASPGLNANPTLKAWVTRVRDRLVLLGAGNASPQAEPAPPAAGFSERLRQLTAAPSKPPVSAARLTASTSTSFAPNSATALQVVGAAMPAARAQLGTAIAGHVAAAPRPSGRVFAMRIRAGLFGRNFPKQMDASGDRTSGTREIGEWPIIVSTQSGTSFKEFPQVVTLDAAYDGITPGSWLLIDMRTLDRLDSRKDLRVAPAAEMVLAKIVEVLPKISRADYGGAGDTTALILPAGTPWIAFRTEDRDDDGNGSTAPGVTVATGGSVQAIVDREYQLIRRTTVYARPEELELAERPITGDFCVHDGDAIELDGFYGDLEPGRYVIVSGERTDIGDTEGVVASEVTMIADVRHDVRRIVLSNGAEAPLPGDRVRTFVTFSGNLSYCYRRETVVIHGNVVKATHGETRAEPLGNGDARIANAAFALKQAPLTYLPAPTARGASPELEIFVDDIRWHLVEHLVDAGPTDRAYILRGGEGGKAEIRFGDGREGARPTTGIQNLRAVYRTGIGRPGNVRAGQISQLVSRPLGLREVVNPLPATGGADAESLDQLRRNAPLATMALDRVVSVRDHADFARAFAGIAKADAQLLTDGARRLVHLTVAAEDDAPLDATSDLVIALRQALAGLGDPFSPTLVAPRELKLLVVAAAIRIDPDRVWEKVVAAVRADLLDRFGFDRRDLGQGIAASAVVAAIQRIPGVAHVDLDTFGAIATMAGAPGERAPQTPEAIKHAIDGVADRVLPWVSAEPARSRPGGFLVAELLILSPDVPATLILNRRD
jgi:hypothetical protein